MVTYGRAFVAFLIALTVSGCSAKTSHPTLPTCEDIPSSDWSLSDENNKELNHWNSSSYERAAATKLTYKQCTFYPHLEHAAMEKKVHGLNLDPLLKQIECSNPHLTLLRDGRVLASGGEFGHAFPTHALSGLAILDHKRKTVTKLSGLQVPRTDHAVLQLVDGRVIFIGGETSQEFADDGTDNLTGTIELLDLQSGVSRVIGKIIVPRHGVMAELVGDNEILVVGGWNERMIARDERWWPGAEIFRVPKKELTKSNSSVKSPSASL